MRLLDRVSLLCQQCNRSVQVYSVGPGRANLVPASQRMLGRRGDGLKRSIPFAFTPIHTRFIEDWLSELTHAELRVHLVIMRLTWGYGKRVDTISYAQIIEVSRLSRSTVRRAIAVLREYGLLKTAGASRKALLFEVLFPRRFKITGSKALTLVRKALG